MIEVDLPKVDDGENAPVKLEMPPRLLEGGLKFG